MEISGIIESSQRQLDEALTRNLPLKTADFASRITEAAAELPDEFSQSLLRILNLHEGLVSSSGHPDMQHAGEFCFACGAMYEKIQALTLAQMEVENAIIGLDSVSATPLAQAQSEQLSRFIAARDQLFRKTADMTLKILLTGLGLLFLGLIFGIV